MRCRRRQREHCHSWQGSTCSRTAVAKVHRDVRPVADTCVTVVDASTFFKHLHNSKRLNETELGQNADTEEAEALICQLMANQIEYADVVALNKTDLLKSDDIDDVTKAVQSLNPKAKVMPCEQGQVPSISSPATYCSTRFLRHRCPSRVVPMAQVIPQSISRFIFVSAMLLLTSSWYADSVEEVAGHRLVLKDQHGCSTVGTGGGASRLEL